MRILIAVFLLACLPLRAARQEVFKFREATPWSEASGEKGYAKLTIEEPRLHRGERSAVEYTFYNTGSGHWLYNWSFNRPVPLPGQLAIYDSNKEYIGDLIRFEAGSQRLVEDGDWIFCYQGTHVGRKIEFRAGYVPLTQYDTVNTLLPAGRYYIRLILYQAFTSNPTRVVGDKPDFYKAFDRSELIRSNAIEIEIFN